MHAMGGCQRQLLARLAVALACAAAVSAAARLPADLHSSLLRDGHARVDALIAGATAESWLARVLAAARAEEAACARCPAAAVEDPANSTCFCCPAASASSPRSFFRARRLAAHDASLAALPHARELARAAAAALAVPRVRLYQWSAFIKAPGDGVSAWHQDAAASPLAGDKSVTVWLALSAVPAEAGPLRFASGSHLPGVPLPSLRDVPLAQRLARMALWDDADMARTGCPLTPARAMNAGDATLHLGWTLHAAPPNLSPYARVALAVQYFADGARIHPDLLALDDGEAAVAAATGAVMAPAAHRGVRFEAAEGGPALLVRLLADDTITWSAWLRARPPLLVPGAPVAHPELTPLVWGDPARLAGRDMNS